MTTQTPGIGGTLLPQRYLAVQLLADVSSPPASDITASTSTRLRRWWQHASSSCGPTSPLRVLFDDMAMPLLGILGFTAHDAQFDAATCRVRLATRHHTPVAFVLARWATRPSARWADLARHAHVIGAAWGLVLSPPFLSVVPTRGHASRRSIDISLPLAVESSARHLLAVAHASRFDPGRVESRHVSFDEILARASAFQDEVRIDLQLGVERSLRVLAPAIARADAWARPRTSRHPRSAPSSFDEALTIVYRILFLLFAESRRLVPTDAPVYRGAYAVSQFCRDAANSPAPGLWDALAATSRLSRLGCSAIDMSVAPFNGALFARASAPVLEQRRRRATLGPGGEERDEAVRRTLVALGSRRTRAGIETINYRDLGVEQLGAVYERVLDLDPAPSAPERDGRGSRHSRVRRQTGTFYTPQPLAEFVVRRTLAPLVDGASADRILDLRVVDPAMGSGAFLVAACRYLAGAYEDALVAEGRMSPEDIDDHERARMRRLVAERCLAGVDRNPTAVHLARLSLWLTTLSHGRPLSFLDHRLRIGDSLIGAWPDDLRRLTMRATRAAAALPLFEAGGLDEDLRAAGHPIELMLTRPDDTVSDVHAKEAAWRHFQSAGCTLHRWRLAAHVWCARWFERQGVTPTGAETRALLDAITRADGTLHSAVVAQRMRAAAALAADLGFFHWPLEFPDVFADTGGRMHARAGFDAVIGNPPWEMLRREDGESHSQWRALLRYVRQSGQYPSCGDGHLNLYQAFVDRSMSILRTGGRLGLVLPWSVATDDGAAALRNRLLTHTSLDVIAGLDNAQGLFPIHRGLRFAVIATTVGAPTHRVHLVCGLRTGDQIDALPARGAGGPSSVVLTPDLLSRVGGATRRVPDLRRGGDLELLRSLSDRFPRLGSTDGWQVSFGRELNATDAGPHLVDRARTGVRVVEGKHVSPYTVDLASTRSLPWPALRSMLDPARIAHARLAYRDVSGVANRLSLIAAVIPAGVVTTHTVFCLRTRLDPARQHFLCALFNSFVLNAVVRLLMGGHVTTTLAASLPTPVWRGDQRDRRIAALARRLSRGQGAGSAGARLQALVACRFELTRAEFAHVLARFPLVPAVERADALSCFERIRT